MKKIILLLLSMVIMTSYTYTTFADSYIYENNDAISVEVVDNPIYDEAYYVNLKNDIQTLIAEADALGEDEWSMFIEENIDLIHEIDSKFTDYVNYHMSQYLRENAFSSELEARNSVGYRNEKIQLLSDMVGRDLTVSYPIVASDSQELRLTSNGFEYYGQFYYDYFNSPATYGLRGSYMSFGMWPKTDVRLFAIMAEAAWPCVKGLWAYAMLTNLSGLYDQYMCHHYGYIEAEWNIEPARPDVGLVQTMAALCNP